MKKDDRFIVQDISHTLETNFMPYAMSVIISRAIPEIDGFKPAHRKLLYTMYKMGLLTGTRTKSANIVGQTMKLNPHGDGAIYETMVRLTRANEALLHPFIDSKGNFGKQYSRDMAYAASRYTEAKLDPICNEVFGEIDRDTVDFMDNYDSTMTEPVLLPTTFPNVLVNPNQGIAVGMASNIASFNLREVCAATMAFLDDPNCDIMDYMVAPDFSTGASVIYDKEEMRRIYETGRGSFKVRSSYRYDKKNSLIEIYEIPYTTSIEAIMEKIIELIKAGKLREINDLRDESDLSGLKITIDVKRNTDPDLLMQKLYRMTPLEDSFGCNFNILINGRPHVLSVKGILEQWVDFRIGCIERGLRFELQRKKEKLHLLEALRKILLDIDRAIAIIRKTEEEAMVIPNLIEGFSIDKVQAEFIAEIKLRNLNKEYILKRIAEIEDLQKSIAEIEDTLKSEKKIKSMIKADLKRISNKYGQDRKTKLIQSDTVEHYDETEMIPDYPVRVFFTKEGYLKKIPLTSLRSSGTEQKMKEDDVILQEFECSNKLDLIVLTNQQNAYKTKLYELPDGKVSVLGEYLPGVLDMEKEEEPLYVIATADYAGMLLVAFENGKVNKTPLSGFLTKTNRKKLTGAFFGGSKPVGMRFISEESEFVLFSAKERALCFNSEAIPLKTTKSSQGVQVMSVSRGNTCIAMKAASECGFADIATYRVKNFPVIGKLIREEDRKEKQIGLFEN